MTKNYQMKTTQTSALAVPEQVSVTMDEIAADMREGLLALAVGAGLQVMQQLMETDVSAACGAKGKHNPDRAARRHGTEAGSVTLGGRRVPVRRPRARASDGTGEVAVPAYARRMMLRCTGAPLAGRTSRSPSTRPQRGRRAGAVNRPRQVLANCVMSSVKSRTMSADRVGRRSAIASR